MKITGLPGAPNVIYGVIVLQGNTLPVFNMRKRFNYPERSITVSDRMIIARLGHMLAALPVDSVSGVTEHGMDLSAGVTKIMPSLRYVKGIRKLDDGLVIIHDLEQFLSLDEELRLKKAVDKSKENE